MRSHIINLTMATLAGMMLDDTVHRRTEKMSAEQYAAAKEAERLERERQRKSEEERRRERQAREKAEWDAAAAPYREARLARKRALLAKGHGRV
jgi:ribosomal protein L12E/L44/L45/RPP1/RPP2